MNEKIDLVSNPKKTYWKVTIPLLSFAIFDAFYGLVDIFWASQLTSDSFYAICVSTPLLILICCIGECIGQGTNSIMSRYIGSNDYNSTYNSIIHGLILIGIVWIICLFSIEYIDDIFVLLNVEECVDLAIIYTIPLFIFSIILLIVNYFSQTLQAEGNSKTPTILIIGSNILNIILDPIFMFVFKLDILGASYATIISFSTAAIIMIYWYLSKKTKVPLNLKYFNIRLKIFYEILKVAIPNLFSDAIWCISSIYINGILIDDLGKNGILLYSTSSKIRDVLLAPIKGLGKGVMILSGHLFGAKKINELKNIYSYVLKISVSTALIVGITFLFIRDFVYNSFNITNMELSVLVICIFGIFIFLSISVSYISSKMIDGFGKSYYSLILITLKIVLLILITSQRQYFPKGASVLVAILICELMVSIIYYLLLKFLFKRFESTDRDDLKVI